MSVKAAPTLCQAVAPNGEALLFHLCTFQMLGNCEGTDRVSIEQGVLKVLRLHIPEESSVLRTLPGAARDPDFGPGRTSLVL